MPINWMNVADQKNPPPGALPLSAEDLNQLAVTADIATPGTPTGDAVSAAVSAAIASGAAPLRATRTTQTGATYTFVVGDANTLVEGNSASAQTFTVPNSVFTAEDTIVVRQYGAGQITIAAGTGTTARSRGAALKLAGQYAEATISFRSSSDFVVTGDLTT